MLICAFADANTFKADIQSCMVHHREHTGQSAVCFADQVAHGSDLVAEGHGSSRTRVDAKLVLNAGTAKVVPPCQRAVLIDEKLWAQEQRQALRTRWRIWEPREYKVNDVCCQVMFTLYSRGSQMRQRVRRACR